MGQGAQPRAMLCPACHAELQLPSPQCSHCQAPRPTDGWPSQLTNAANTVNVELSHADQLPPSIAPPMMLETPVPQISRSQATPSRLDTPPAAPVRPLHSVVDEHISRPRPSVPISQNKHELPSISTQTLHTATPTVIPARSLWVVTVAGLLLLIGLSALVLWLPNGFAPAATQPEGPALHLPTSYDEASTVEPADFQPIVETTQDVTPQVEPSS
ncbi:MAG: hypothetical protein ACI9MC_002290, partial [Kiritimatiellia bacterium]